MIDDMYADVPEQKKVETKNKDAMNIEMVNNHTVKLRLNNSSVELVLSVYAKALEEDLKKLNNKVRVLEARYNKIAQTLNNVSSELNNLKRETKARNRFFE